MGRRVGGEGSVYSCVCVQSICFFVLLETCCYLLSPPQCGQYIVPFTSQTSSQFWQQSEPPCFTWHHPTAFESVLSRGHHSLTRPTNMYWNSLYGQFTFCWLLQARASPTLQQTLSLQRGQRGLCAGISIALSGASAGAGRFLQCRSCHDN